VLTKVILFKGSPRYYKNYFQTAYHNYKIKQGIKKGNFVPFATIKLFSGSRNMRTEYKVENLLGNILIFIPLGFLLPLLIKRFRNTLAILLAGFFLSVFYECFQLATGIGVFDVDDMLLNTLGTAIGVIIFWIIKKLFPSSSSKEVSHITASSSN
jgi:glycopeptide antibiotics resistance protein